jgi:glutamyl-tRNA synthetase
MKVKTRFAPSPTGFLHIGGVRTALFSWLFARHHGGEFILRIEDTDRERSTEASIQAILDGLSWVGLDHDEGPYYQMRRLERYREVADSLLKSGAAYHCYCSREELDAMRTAQVARGENPRYDGRCRDRREPVPGVRPVVRFRNPRDGAVTVHDLIRGDVTFANAELDDLVLLRPDGVPTFHFGVVVDDADMAVTHVIRGDDHLTNTPRHINLYHALGWTVPTYAHLPMILGADGARLSKRHGAVNVLEYRDQGYLPEALLNYLLRLGWSHGDQEIFSRDEMVQLFDLDGVNPAASRFNPEKLAWLNQQYIMGADASRLGALLAEQLHRRGLPADGAPPPEQVAQAFRERAQTLAGMADAAAWLYVDPPPLDDKAARQHLKAANQMLLGRVRDLCAQLPVWERGAIHDGLQALAAELGVGFGKIGQPVRVAATGRTVSPPIDVTVELVGRERMLRRLDRALEYAAANVPAGGA